MEDTEVGVAPDALTEAALAWSTEENEWEGQPPRWHGCLKWAALVVLFCATAVAVLWLSVELLHALARPVVGMAAPGPPAVSSAPAIAPVAPAPAPLPAPAAAPAPAPAPAPAAQPTLQPAPPSSSMAEQDQRFINRAIARGKTVTNRSVALANAHYFCTTAAGKPDADSIMATRMDVSFSEAVSFDTDAIIAYDDC